MSSGCSGDPLLLLPGVALLHSGLLTAALLLAACFGLIAAALIHIFFLKPFFFTKQFKSYDPWSLLEVEERDEETESGSVERKTVPSETLKQAEPVNSDVAAFALKAKVVYPINQRYRPLADGASNPSLHENQKPNAAPDEDSMSSSADDWPSQEREEDESSQDIGSESSPQTQQSLSFRRVQHYPQTLCYPEGEGKVSRLCMTLQNLHRHTALLQQEKCNIFQQIIRVLLSRENCGLEADLQQQEKKLEQLKKDIVPELLRWEKGAEPGSVICTIEEVEKAGRDKLEHTLHTALSFAKQLEQFCQFFHSSTTGDVLEETACSIIHCLQLVEQRMSDIQASFMKTLCDRLQWWEEFSGWLRIRMTLLSQEIELRVKLTIQSLEELTADGQLGFGHMEKLISDMQTLVSEELQHCSDEIRQQTVDLVCEFSRKFDVKMRKMMKAQVREWSRTLESHDYEQKKLQQLTELMQELQEKHRKQKSDYELQHDRRVSDAVCELWKKLFHDFSGRLPELWKECVLSMLTTRSVLSVEESQTLLDNIELTLTSQIQQEESYTQHLHKLREQMERDRQIWTEEELLATSCLKHLSEQHMKVTLAAVSKQRDIQNRNLMGEKQRLLVVEIQRILSARHFYIQSVKDMKLTQFSLHSDTQTLQQEHLSELETASELIQEHAQFLIGHALTYSARLRLVDSPNSDTAATNDRQKEQLKEEVCKRLNVTQDSVTALVMNYNTRIQTVITATQHSQQQQQTKIRERQRKRGQYLRTLQRDLNIWARKPHSAEFYKRVEQQKRVGLSRCEEECVCEDLGEMVDPQKEIHTIRQQLREEEDRFLLRLVSLAKIPLTDAQINSGAGAEKSSMTLKRRERERPLLNTSTYRLANTEN
ncbi:evC complex member EVC [Hoplias malabaricus]|uniref:evC complex member EVC n=1 Tax=Hoplias malabaricus TaxID=27720 RepID=UPI0034626955